MAGTRLRPLAQPFGPTLWPNISQEDLAEATQYAAEFAAQEAAKVLEHQNIESQLQDLIDSGASQAEIDQYIEDNPAPE